MTPVLTERWIATAYEYRAPAEKLHTGGAANEPGAKARATRKLTRANRKATKGASTESVGMVKCGVLEVCRFQPPNHNEHERFAMAAPILTQDYLKSILHYNPETGVFTWLVSRGGKMPGAVAGTVDRQKGYRRIEIGGIGHRAHRLAFLYMTGRFPENYTDHVDGDKVNNRWANLRDVTHTENMRNQRKRANGTSDCMGVHWAKKARKWVAYIYVNNGRTHLGSFDQYDTAVAARKAAEVAYGYHANHGRPA